MSVVFFKGQSIVLHDVGGHYRILQALSRVKYSGIYGGEKGDEKRISIIRTRDNEQLGEKLLSQIRGGYYVFGY